MALFAYVDDSGSEPSQPVFVLGGLILPEEAWKMFSSDWQHVLDSHPKIEYFKASEVWDHHKGPFKDATTKERQGKVHAFVDIIYHYRPLAISTRVEWSVYREFAKKYNLDGDFSDPYFFLFFALIGQTVALAADYAHLSNVSFIFDEQGRVGEHARLWYQVLLSRSNPRILELLGQTPDFGDEKKNLPLQGADMFAWYQRRAALGSIGHESHQRIWSIFEEFQYSTILDEEHLQRIASNLNFPTKE